MNNNSNPQSRHNKALIIPSSSSSSFRSDRRATTTIGEGQQPSNCSCSLGDNNKKRPGSFSEAGQRAGPQQAVVAVSSGTTTTTTPAGGPPGQSPSRKRPRRSTRRVQFEVDPSTGAVVHFVIPIIVENYDGEESDNNNNNNGERRDDPKGGVAPRRNNRNEDERSGGMEPKTMLERGRAAALAAKPSEIYKEVLALSYLGCCCEDRTNGNNEQEQHQDRRQQQQQERDGSGGSNSPTHSSNSGNNGGDMLLPACLTAEHLGLLGLGAGESRGLEIHVLPRMGYDRLRRRKNQIRQIVHLSSLFKTSCTTPPSPATTTSESTTSTATTTAEGATISNSRPTSNNVLHDRSSFDWIVTSTSLELSRSARMYAQTIGAADAMAALAEHQASSSVAATTRTATGAVVVASANNAGGNDNSSHYLQRGTTSTDVFSALEAAAAVSRTYNVVSVASQLQVHHQSRSPICSVASPVA